MTELQVLLVEDDPIYLEDFKRTFPDIFTDNGVKATLHPCGDFGDAERLAGDPAHRFDLIVSDTYRGPTKNGDADVLKMVTSYRGKRFCPLVVFSSGVKPDTLEVSPFVIWADKAKPGDIESAIATVLKTGVPQIARSMHDELEQSAGTFLWGFLVKHWADLSGPGKLEPKVLERLIRRRAAVQIGDLHHDGNNYFPLVERCASEYYIYPKLVEHYYSLGDILRNRKDASDFRVVLTPHCHLFKQPGKEKPRADFVLTVKAHPSEKVLGTKITEAKKDPTKTKLYKKLGEWARSPALTQQLPEGRHWYLPKFIEIPHLFCDLMQVESIPYQSVESDFKAIATLIPPYAEALQSCFVGFYGSVGIPSMKVESIEDLLG